MEGLRKQAKWEEPRWTGAWGPHALIAAAKSDSRGCVRGRKEGKKSEADFGGGGGAKFP